MNFPVKSESCPWTPPSWILREAYPSHRSRLIHNPHSRYLADMKNEQDTQVHYGRMIEPYLTVKQAAEYFRVSGMTISRWCQDGRLTKVCLSRYRYGVSAESIRAEDMRLQEGVL